MRFNKILIVDDSATTRIMIRTYLKGLGYKVVLESDNGDTALDAVSTAAKNDNPYDLLLVDINMPKMDGIQLVKFVRETLGNSQPHILMITAESSKEVVLRGLRAGVDSYLLKPVSPSNLKEAIDKLPAQPRGMPTP